MKVLNARQLTCLARYGSKTFRRGVRIFSSHAKGLTRYDKGTPSPLAHHIADEHCNNNTNEITPTALWNGAGYSKSGGLELAIIVQTLHNDFDGPSVLIGSQIH